MLTPSGIVVDGVELLANDLFRVVHDVFAHAKEGHQFGPAGEEKAWLEHYGMFSPLARPALAAETRGQTCWMYFGPHLRDTNGALIGAGEPGWVPVRRRPYAGAEGRPAARRGEWRPADPRRGPAGCWPTRCPAGGRTPAARCAPAGSRSTYPTGSPTPTGRRPSACWRRPGRSTSGSGGPAPDLDALVRRDGGHCWAYLTASSPGGRTLSVAENQRRNRALRRRLEDTGATVLPGAGIGDDPGWPPEDSVLAVGLDRSTAAALGADFGQDAVVVGDLDTQAELLWCR